MSEQNGIIKPEVQELPQIEDRMTFIYLEHCQISRDEGAITVNDLEGTIYIPAAQITVLLFGPGTDVTQRAMELIGDMGISVIWLGEMGVRYYAHGRALNTHTKLLEKQAEFFSNQKKHLEVVRKMYEMRFNDDTSGLTMQQLRGREGARMRKIYKDQSEKNGVPWNGREYNPDDFNSSTPVNKALSSGNACLYGLAAAVITALGCTCGLGFVHVGHELSFAYDIADLYKSETSIPLAFELASQNTPDIGNVTRRRMRDIFKETHLLERMVKDIKFLLDDVGDEKELDIALWNNGRDFAKYGTMYGKEE